MIVAAGMATSMVVGDPDGELVVSKVVGNANGVVVWSPSWSTRPVLLVACWSVLLAAVSAGWSA